MKFFALLLTFLLLACGQKQLDKLEEKAETAYYDEEAVANFLTTLSKEYNRTASIFKKQGFMDDAKLMAEKAKLAGKRNATYYTETSFNLTPEKLDEIQLARLFFERLRGNILIFNHFPESLARMQVYYDCMILEYKDTLSLNRSYCREKFDIMQKGFQRSGFTRNIRYNSTRETFVIYFDLGSSKVKEEFYPILGDVAKRAKAMNRYKINLVGLADKTSTKEINTKLSRERAENVKAIFVRMGIQAGLINFEYHADNFSLIETEKAEKFNRRVVIDLIEEK
jgi:outer membrane protein OmpA-like peptidoglycan-associated protein